MSGPDGHSAARECALPGSPLDRESAGLDLCVHCGFCLPACPTYLTLEDENDSPRGRLVLMRGLLTGELAPDDPAVTPHFDRCLGCRGCESACPSGVPYGRLLESTRATINASRGLPPLARVILAVFSRPWALRAFLAMARVLRATGLPRLLARLPRDVSFPFAMLASTEPAIGPTPYPATEKATGPAASLLTGCVMEGLCTATNRATERVLAYNGVHVIPAPGQGCCGALHAHAGDAAGARELARRNIAAFEASGAEVIATNASGCGAMLRDYEHLLREDPAWHQRAGQLAAKVRDVSQLLAERGPRRGAPLPYTVAWDAPCHLQHAMRVVDPPARVLAAVPGLRIVPLVDSDQCCGSAGIYNLVEPDTSNRVLDAKLACVDATGADFVVTSNPGCLMQIGAGLRTTGHRTRVIHLVDLLDASYAANAD